MYKIFAGNVPPSATEEQLREVFSPHIVIEDVVIARDTETGKPRGYGFVMTRDAERARAAMRKVGKVEINGRRVYFKEATGKQSKKQRPARPQRSRRNRPDRRGGPGGYTGASEPRGGNPSNSSDAR